jgi:hypothetical protein
LGSAARVRVRVVRVRVVRVRVVRHSKQYYEYYLLTSLSSEPFEQVLVRGVDRLRCVLPLRGVLLVGVRLHHEARGVLIAPNRGDKRRLHLQRLQQRLRVARAGSGQTHAHTQHRRTREVRVMGMRACGGGGEACNERRGAVM